MRLYAVTLCFSSRWILEAGLKRHEETSDFRTELHVLLDNHYPLWEGRHQSKVAELYGLRYVSPPEHLGLHRGFNRACEEFDGIQDNDAVLCYDPDSYPLERGWDRAMLDVLAADPSVGVVGLMNPRCLDDIKRVGYSEYRIADRRVWEPKKDIVISVSAWRWGYLRRAGGFQEPTAFYGHLEAAMWRHAERLGLRWAYLPDFREDDRLRDLHDPEYEAWKRAHAHEGTFPGSFEEYLRRHKG